MQVKFKSNEKNIATAGEVCRVDWHRPNVSRIDIKRTLLGAGSVTDGSDFKASV